METLTLILNNITHFIKAFWRKQSNRTEYITFIVVIVPSLIFVRDIYWYFYRKYHSLPPGPNGLPLIGFTHQYLTTKSRINLSKKYGHIFYGSYIAGVPVVVLSSSQLVKQIFPQKQFLDRQVGQLFDPKKIYHPSIGSVGSSQTMSFHIMDGQEWNKRRKLSQDALFKILNNKTVTDSWKEIFAMEVKPYLMDIVNSDKIWYSREIFEYISLNTIYSTIFGKNLDRNSKLFQELKKDLNDTMKLTMIDFMVIQLPGMKYIYGDKLDKVRNRRNETLLRLVNDRINDKNKKGQSYIDYTHEMVINGELTQDKEIADLMILFMAGMDTTSSTLEMGVVLLAKYQDIQDKVRKELLNVMGKEYDIKLVNKCPLFRAAVHEILRISSVAYSGLAHSSDKDYWLTMDDGTKYKIPKKSLVNMNLDYIHIYGKDENWKRTNGDEIILENFLIQSEDGQMRFVKNESFIPFGVGKRDCVGRQLAMKEIQYTLGYLLMNYEISLEDKQDVMDKDITLMRSVSQTTAFLDAVIPLKIRTV